MSSLVQLSSPSLLSRKLRCNPPLIRSSHLNCSRITRCRLFCSLISPPRSNLEVSWVDGSSNDEFGGWFVRRKPVTDSRSGVPKFVLAGVGASVAVLLAAFACFSFSKRGFKFRFGSPFDTLHELLISSKPHKVLFTESNAPEDTHALETKVDDKYDIESDLSKRVDHASAPRESKRIIVPVAADPIQLEALDVLKKLEIIENDVSANELCTRREYARWFVKANSMLERNPKHKIVPTILSAGSTVTAFDDVSTDDPDFWCIQALGEAGIILSRLSTMNSSFSDIGSSEAQENFEFFPESFVSRFDLVNWKVMLEYPFSSEIKEKMLRTNVGILDVSASSLDTSTQLLTDLMSDDKSIVRRVFGNIRLLQPQKPVTKAQAAVALTSGRMAVTIRSEISRLESENKARLLETEVIRSELTRRGEILRIWEERLNKEKERGPEIESNVQAALLELEKEKTAQIEGLAEYMKEKATQDYQQQLLFSLEKEVDDMYNRLATERANIFAEQQSLNKLSADLQNQQDAMVEAKSILQAEKEAVRILRYWVEEEARKIQARGKTLEQAARRWKWDSDSDSGKLS